MVGMVIVSHNRALAEAVRALAQGVGGRPLNIAVAGGAGDEHRELGTDPTDIVDAIRAAKADGGVLVLMDLGSAIISARLAREMLADEIPGIRLCPAPLVEGAVAAAVRIGAGANLDEACREAQTALEAKNNDLAPEPDANAPASVAPAAPMATTTGGAEDVPADALRYRFGMNIPNGMHARPAAEFVKAVAGLDVQARLRNASVASSDFVDGRSLNRIALANIRRGDVAEAAFWGPDAAKARAAIVKLVAESYHGWEAPEGDDASAPAPAPTSASASTSPDAAAVKDAVPERLAPGVALGTLLALRTPPPPPPPVKIDNPDAEVARLDAAIAIVRQTLAAARDRLGPARKDEAGILDAQILTLNDATVLDPVRARVRDESLDAAGVFSQALCALADDYRAVADPYRRERAADVDGVADMVRRVLAGESPDAPGDDDGAPIVLWAEEATPSMFGRYGEGRLQAVLTGRGGRTSHVAILANARGIPALTGCPPPPADANGRAVAVDANARPPEIVYNPDDATIAGFRQRRENWREALRRDLADGQGEALARDGRRIPVFANVGDARTARRAAECGAEGIGLLRTEFLFLDRRDPPGEDEQVAALREALAPFAGRPAVVRTLDAGGDKPMPWLNLPKEANPFLGVRGIRLARARPEIFATQLRAILRAGVGADAGEAGGAGGVGIDLRIMVPMVATIDEIDFARQALADAHSALDREKIPHAWPVRFGIMIETPAAVLCAGALAERVDFFSMGTNDLTQYVMCAERGNPSLAKLSDGLHPAVLEAIALTVAGAKPHNVEVAVCGEMAADPASLRALLGLGVDHVSVNAPAVGGVKRTIRAADPRELSQRAAKARALPDAAAVRLLFNADVECRMLS